MMAAPGHNIQEVERAYELETAANAAADLGLLDRAIFHVNHGAARMTGHQVNQEHQLARAILICRAWNTLWLARKALSRGYLPQALLLARSALEDWGTTCYVRKHPSEAHRWLYPPKPPTAKGQTPNFAQIWADLEPEYGDTLREVYEDVSMFAHPRAVGLPYLVTRDESGFQFQVGPPTDWDRQAFDVGLYYLLQIAQMLFRVVGALWEEVAGSIERPWFDEAKRLSDEIIKRMQAQDTTWKEAKQAPSSAPS